MPIKNINISDLQPTDGIRVSSFSFLSELTTEEIEKLGLPQVWKTPEGLLVSDGNNRLSVLASRGQEVIKINYKGKVPEYLQEFKRGITNQARTMKSKGIFSFYDLLER